MSEENIDEIEEEFINAMNNLGWEYNLPEETIDENGKRILKAEVWRVLDEE